MFKVYHGTHSSKDMTSEHEKAQLGADALQAFFKQFGDTNDPIQNELIEILLQELMNAKVVSLLSQPEQTGDQTRDGSQE